VPALGAVPVTEEQLENNKRRLRLTTAARSRTMGATVQRWPCLPD
jgi:hypothetical protein